MRTDYQPNFKLRAFQFRHCAAQHLDHERLDAVGRRRTTGQEIFNVHDFVHRHHALEQRRHDAVAVLGQARVVLGIVDVGALEDVFVIAQAELVADGGHVAGDGTIAEGDQHLGAGADFMEHFEVVLVADGAFDEADVHIVRISLEVHDRAVNELDLAGEFDEKFVEVEE